MATISGKGNLGADPILKYVGEDKRPVTELRVYLQCGRKDKKTGEWEDNGDWYNVSLWGPCAEPASKLLQKGNGIYLTGTLSTDRWNDKESGEPKSHPRIDADFVAPYLPAVESITYRPAAKKDAA